MYEIQDYKGQQILVTNDKELAELIFEAMRFTKLGPGKFLNRAGTLQK